MILKTDVNEDNFDRESKISGELGTSKHTHVLLTRSLQ